jgi:transposase
MNDGNGSPNWEQRNYELQARFEELERKLADALEKLAKATKNSANSSKPPASDIVKPIRTRKSSGERKKGGQKGHKRIVRPLFADDELDWLKQHSH